MDRGDRLAGIWVDPDEDPREAAEGLPGAESDERVVLLEYLRHYRLTLELKCGGLSAEQLAQRSAPPPTMSLLGLIRHMAEEERHLRRVMAGALGQLHLRLPHRLQGAQVAE